MEFLFSNLISFIVILIIVFIINYIVTTFKKEYSESQKGEIEKPEKEEKGIFKYLYYGSTVLLVIYVILYLPIEALLGRMGYERSYIAFENTIHKVNPFIILGNIGAFIFILGIIIKVLFIKKVKYKKADLVIWILAFLLMELFNQISKMA